MEKEDLLLKKRLEELARRSYTQNMVVFTDNTYLYTLSSTIDRAELIKMAESLVEQ